MNIKFRGISKSQKIWVYGSYDQYREKYPAIYDIERKRNYDIIPETVGQFTGLHDKNGVEIYEGDKVAFRIDNPYGEDIISSGVVVWIENSFMIECTTYENKIRYFKLKDTYLIEVVGNIHEEPTCS